MENSNIPDVPHRELQLKHHKLCAEFLEGKRKEPPKWQYRGRDGNWRNVSTAPAWLSDHDYRLVPRTHTFYWCVIDSGNGRVNTICASTKEALARWRNPLTPIHEQTVELPDES